MLNNRLAPLFVLPLALVTACAGGNDPAALSAGPGGTTSLSPTSNASASAASGSDDVTASPTTANDDSASASGATSAGDSAAAATGASGGATSIVVQQAAADGTQLCVDVPNGATANGTRVALWGCNGGVNQRFTLDGKLLRVYGNKCLNVVDRVNANGTAIQIWDCSDKDSAMLWTYSNNHLRYNGTDKCLDVTDGVFGLGTKLQLWACNETSPNQTFRLSSSQVSSAPSAAAPAETTPASPAPSGTMTPSTSGTTLSLRGWQQEVWGAGAFNHEQQKYTNSGANVSFAGDGTATLVARPTGGNGWSSARLSGDEMGPLPWYLEADLTAPAGKGSWPAFWLTSRGSWPQGGEIDVMEQINGTGQTHISTHWGANTGNPTFNTHEIINNVRGQDRHRYGVWITAQGLQFYLDGKIVGNWVTFPAQSNFSQIASKMVPIVNVAMGGDWPGYAPQSTGEQRMVVYRVSRDTKPPSR